MGGWRVLPGGLRLPRSRGGSGGQPWTATTWTLNSLREWGIDAEVLRERRTVELLSANSRWEYEDLPYWSGEVDCCINAWTVANGVWLGADVTGIVEWFLEHQMSDGGWNCEWVEGSTRSSFHSTLNSLKGLLAYDAATGGSETTRAARTRRRGIPLAAQSLSPSVDRRTGGSVGGPLHLSLPLALQRAECRRVLSRGVAARRREPDPRMAQAIEIIRSARQPDGTWLQGARLPGRVWFEVDVPEGEPSKWLTLSATRVLAWWDSR